MSRLGRDGWSIDCFGQQPFLFTAMNRGNRHDIQSFILRFVVGAPIFGITLATMICPAIDGSVLKNRGGEGRGGACRIVKLVACFIGVAVL